MARSTAPPAPASWKQPARSAAARPAKPGSRPGFDLPAKWVIHTVGPVWQGGHAGEDELLASCYRESLKLAASVGATTVAFPAISTGAYGFPLERAARIAVDEIVSHLGRHPEIERILIAVRGDEAMRIHSDALAKRLNGS